MIVSNVTGSLARFCQDVIEDLHAQGLSQNAQFLNFDFHADVHELPPTDLLGIIGLAIDEDDKEHTVTVGFCVTCFDDLNGFRHREIMAMLYERLRPEMTLTYYDAATAEELGWMVVIDGTSLLPVGRSEVRPFQFLQVAMKVSPGLTQR